VRAGEQRIGRVLQQIALEQIEVGGNVRELEAEHVSALAGSMAVRGLMASRSSSQETIGFSNASKPGSKSALAIGGGIGEARRTSRAFCHFAPVKIA
jgi:hypothetical protein